MTTKPTYEELKQRVKKLEREVSECSRSAEELRQEQSVFIGGPVVVFTWLAIGHCPAEYAEGSISDKFASSGLTPTDWFGSVTRSSNSGPGTKDVKPFS